MSEPEKFQFRLYLAGAAPNSARALQNLRELCQSLLPGRHEIEVVDVTRQPERALADGVLLTPTLFKLSPAPIQSIVGNLSDRAKVVRLLELEI